MTRLPLSSTAFLVAVPLLLTGLGACGGDGAEGPPSSGSDGSAGGVRRVPPTLPEEGLVDSEALRLLRELTIAVEADAGDAEPWVALGLAYRAHGRVPEARSALETATELDDGNPHTWYHLARVRHDQSEHELALDALGRARRLAPEEGNLAWREGFWLLEVPDLAAAEASFRIAAEFAPLRPEGALGLARVALEDGRPEEARTILETLLAAELEDPFLHQLLGRALRDLGDTDGARVHLTLGQGETELWRDPWDADLAPYQVGQFSSLEMARAMIETGRASEALQLLDSLEDIDPLDYRVVTSRSAAYFVQGDHARARAVLEEALSSGADHYRIHLSLGLVVFQEEGPEPALVHVDAALVRNSDLAEAHLLRARLLRQLGRYDEAIPELRRALANGERELDVHHALGTALLQLGELDGAEEVYLRAAEEHPSEARPEIMLARIYLTRSQTAAARSAVDAARALDPEHPLLPELEVGVAELESAGR